MPIYKKENDYAIRVENPSSDVHEISTLKKNLAVLTAQKERIISQKEEITSLYENRLSYSDKEIASLNKEIASIETILNEAQKLGIVEESEAPIEIVAVEEINPI